mmetsp:Transcript_97205/g.203023  ORF Transcript_97205/g.203023 Transcript_97205/m.203023 type:complete len:277 (-) Transcript_97205:405-1235(-)
MNFLKPKLAFRTSSGNILRHLLLLGALLRRWSGRRDFLVQAVTVLSHGLLGRPLLELRPAQSSNTLGLKIASCCLDGGLKRNSFTTLHGIVEAHRSRGIIHRVNTAKPPSFAVIRDILCIHVRFDKIIQKLLDLCPRRFVPEVFEAHVGDSLPDVHTTAHGLQPDVKALLSGILGEDECHNFFLLINLDVVVRATPRRSLGLYKSHLGSSLLGSSLDLRRRSISSGRRSLPWCRQLLLRNCWGSHICLNLRLGPRRGRNPSGSSPYYFAGIAPLRL